MAKPDFTPKANRPDPSSLIGMVRKHGKTKAREILGIAPSTLENWISKAKAALNPPAVPKISDEEWCRRVRAAERRRPVWVPTGATC